MIIGNHLGAIGLPAVSERSQNNYSDYNLLTAGYNRITSETYAQELDQPFFLVNTNKGRISLQQVATQLDRKPAGHAASDKQGPGINIENRQALLKLDEWQKMTGHDRHSQSPTVLRPLLREATLLLSFIIDETPQKVQGPKIEKIEQDFFGNPMPAKPLPGPFQQLKMTSALKDRSKVLEFRGPYNHVKSTKETLNTFMLWPAVKKD